LLRQTLNFASIIHSHSVHFFALAGPDLLLGVDADPGRRNIMTLLDKVPDVARNALRLRSIGQKITELIGGRGTHPVAAVAGGMAAPLTLERQEGIQRLAEEALPLAAQLVEVARSALVRDHDLLTSLPLASNYLGTVTQGALDLYDGTLRLSEVGGGSVEFAEDDWRSYLTEQAVDSSYAKHVVCKSSTGEPLPYRVGALARLNCADRISTPLAQEELERFRELGGSPCHQTVMFHYARLIELLYAVEMLVALVKNDELRADIVLEPPTQAPRRATAHVEAPRGVLIHDYDVDETGVVTAANLVVATQQNMAAINDTIALSAGQLLQESDEKLLDGVEFGIRCYDPCLSCATHRLGEMKLEIAIHQGGSLVRTVRR